MIFAKVTLFLELSVKYIVKSFALLGQHVFQAVVCIEYRAECDSSHTLHNAKLLTMYFTDNSAKV
jgi:hypothetical protein